MQRWYLGRSDCKIKDKSLFCSGNGIGCFRVMALDVFGNGIKWFRVMALDVFGNGIKWFEVMPLSI